MELDNAFPTQPQKFHRHSTQSYKFYKLPSAQPYIPSAPTWVPSYKPPTDEPEPEPEPEPFRISPPNTESYDPSSHKPPTYNPYAPPYEPSSPPTYKPYASSYDPPSHDPSAPSWTPSYDPSSHNPSAPSWTPSYEPESLRNLPLFDLSSLKPPTFKPSAPSGAVPQDPNGDEALFGEVGLHCYNLLNGTNLEFLDLDKFYLTGLFYKEIKLNAYDPIRNVYREFITRVVPYEIEKVYMRFITTNCRLLPEQNDLGDFVELAVDDFFKGDMPNSMPEDTSDNPQYYELKESEVKENMEWLHAYAALAFYIPSSRVWRGPFDLTKVIVQTRENVESEKIAKALNAIFYMHMKTFRGQDCYATIRRTTDGMPGHMSLEVKCLM